MTDIDTKRMRDLLDRRDAIDRELAEIVSGNAPKKPVRCSSCGEDGHTARTCSKRVVE